jgi:hypothetical protein
MVAIICHDIYSLFWALTRGGNLQVVWAKHQSTFMYERITLWPCYQETSLSNFWSNLEGKVVFIRHACTPTILLVFVHRSLKCPGCVNAHRNILKICPTRCHALRPGCKCCIQNLLAGRTFRRAKPLSPSFLSVSLELGDNMQVGSKLCIMLIMSNGHG